ncbi:siderophore-interacting protein [Microbacterium xanthum]|uniref:siderophore-interacting protein n=1 Tax=Microbacterium xanthum TaxID=3079794 RepID=UPI002AD351F7|nr:siderophore-interacting protein [Microbacterium sp. KSW-48]MDZ8171593.1 siderophore-interacting protein [Microbacterium sp. KSW-48]
MTSADAASDQPASATVPRRPRGAQVVLEVVRRESLTPHLVRLHLGGPGFDDFLDGADPATLDLTDTYTKLLLAKPGLGLEPPYDLDALRAELPREDLPSRRTYTIRDVDRNARTIAIDFVVHGDEGLAGPWAASAEPGDRLAMSLPGGGYAPAAGDVTHVIVGDDSALPAIARAVAALAADARGVVIVEVDDEESHVPLDAPSGVEVRWLHRVGSAGAAHPGTLLVAAVEALSRPEGVVDVFAHGERAAMKRLGAIFHGEWGIARQEMSVSAYWAHGRAEDAFQAEKRDAVGKIFAD